MKLSLNWLNDFVKHGLPAEKLAERLTMAGHEVKSIDDVADDRVYEIEITPNRPDCLNIVGLAREVSAIVNKPFKARKIKAFKISKNTCDITIEDKAACSRYVGTIVENVSIGGSPENVTQRLQSVGLRSINNVVDITNYCLFETGQPMHAFDYDKLVGGKIIVRRARAGEKIVTLDGVERTLNANILVIADAQKPVAIAGIMGGQATEVTTKTKRVLLECALFDPILIRRAARSLGLTSDSAYRFERGVDATNLEKSAKQALAMVTETAGGVITHYRDVSVNKNSAAVRSFDIDIEHISNFLGTKLSGVQVKKILTALEFKLKTKGKRCVVAVPSFRNDIKAAVDIAEEIARIIGYDRMPLSLPQVKPSAITTSENFQIKRKLRQILIGQGLDEIISYPLVSRAAIDKTQLTESPLTRIKNPLSLDQEFMRPSLLPSILAIVSLNFNRGQKNLRLFELGKTYSPAEPKGQSGGEKEVLGIILSGAAVAVPDWRSNKKETVDFYDLKGVLNAVLRNLGIKQFEVSSGQSQVLASGQAAELIVDKKVIGSFGKIDKEILKNWDLKSEDIYFAQIELAHFSLKQAEEKFFVHLPEFPSMTRDVSLAVAKDMTFSRITNVVLEVGGPFLNAIHFREQYTGEKIAAGQKGIVFSLVYQSPERTLTESEIAPVHEKILQKLTNELSAIIR
jgi:phenylalanyl-tRNA synthetase beta chain